MSDDQTRNSPRRHTPADKAAALVAVESVGNLVHPVQTVANALGVSHKSIDEWLRGEKLGNPHEVALYRQEIRAEVLRQTERLRSRILDRALGAIDSDEKIPFGQLMSGLRITTEVSQLLSNQPTSIQEQRATQDELQKQFAEQAIEAIMAHKEVDRAAALAYLQEKQPDLAKWAA